jgi:hypothetical protein
MGDQLFSRIRDLTVLHSEQSKIKARHVRELESMKKKISHLEAECLQLLIDHKQDGISMDLGNISYKFLVKTKASQLSKQDKVLKITEIMRDSTLSFDAAAKAICSSSTFKNEGQKYLHVSKKIAE